jgi:hypothetical protein
MATRSSRRLRECSRVHPKLADRKVLAGGLIRMAVAGDELAAAAGTTLDVAPTVVIAAPENKAVVALIALPRRALRAPRDRPVSPVDQVYRDLDAGGSAFHVLLAVGAGRGHTSRLRGRLTASKGRSSGWPTAARFPPGSPVSALFARASGLDERSRLKPPTCLAARLLRSRPRPR